MKGARDGADIVAEFRWFRGLPGMREGQLGLVVVVDGVVRSSKGSEANWLKLAKNEQGLGRACLQLSNPHPRRLSCWSSCSATHSRHPSSPQYLRDTPAIAAPRPTTLTAEGHRPHTPGPCSPPVNGAVQSLAIVSLVLRGFRTLRLPGRGRRPVRAAIPYRTVLVSNCKHGQLPQ